MSRPFRVEIVTPIERKLHILALQLVYNRPVVNPPDRYPRPATLVVKLRPLLLDRLDINGLYP